MKYDILQRLRDDSNFKFVATFYNGSEEHLISNKIKLSVFTFFYFVMKILNIFGSFPCREVNVLSSSGKSTENSEFLGLSYVI